MDSDRLDGLRSRLRRQEATLSLSELARRCRISSRRLEAIEQGHAAATIIQARSIDEVLTVALGSGPTVASLTAGHRTAR